MSITVVNLTAGAPSGASGYAASDTTIGLAKGAAFGAVAPALVDNQNIGSLYWEGSGASANLVIRSDGSASLSDVAAGGGPADQILGDFATIIGAPSTAYFRLSESGADMVLVASCSISQHAFTNIHMVDFGVDFDSASAVFSGGCGTNQWTWVGLGVNLLASTVYSMIVT